MAVIEDAIVAWLQDNHPASVRQVFYAMSVRGVVEKREEEYKRTVCRKLTELREVGRIPFGWISDATRWMRKPTTFSGLAECIEATAEHYRRSLWRDMDVYVEMWCEKDALAGVLVDITRKYDVPLMVSRGYGSISFQHSAAETIAAVEKPAFIYHFGDHDPSGVDAARDTEEKLRRYAPDADITFERVAVTPEQITAWNLPTRPTKTTDTRAKGFEGRSVELDAIPPDKLRRLTAEAINQHIDQIKLAKLRAAEESERDLLRRWARSMEAQP